MKIILSLLLGSLLVSSCSFFTDEGKAIDIAKYNIIKNHLKNPDSMYTENFKVIDKLDYRLTGEQVAGDYTLWFIHGDVNATNGFGGNIKNGYCVVFFVKKDGGGYGQNYQLQECSRGNPTSDEVAMMKNLFGWDKYQQVAIQQ